MDSILGSIKKLLGIGSDYTQFDIDIMIGINSALAILGQLGVGPASGFVICDDTSVWSDLLGDDVSFEAVKSYVYLKVKLLFDPPSSSALIESINRMLSELEWRISVHFNTNDDEIE